MRHRGDRNGCAAKGGQRQRGGTRWHAYFYPNWSTLNSIYSPNSYRILLLFDSKKSSYLSLEYKSIAYERNCRTVEWLCSKGGGQQRRGGTRWHAYFYPNRSTLTPLVNHAYVAVLGRHRPSFKVNLRPNPSQSKATTDGGSSRNTTTTVCELTKFRRNHILTKKALR
jgi:hypothetical protein